MRAHAMYQALTMLCMVAVQKFMGGMPGAVNMQMAQQLMANQQMSMQNLLLQGQASLGQPAVLQIVQDLKARVNMQSLYLT